LIAWFAAQIAGERRAERIRALTDDAATKHARPLTGNCVAGRAGNKGADQVEGPLGLVVTQRELVRAINGPMRGIEGAALLWPNELFFQIRVNTTMGICRSVLAW
jgi:hypothetical protein